MVTIKDLAEYTKISKSTISRYLNDGYVSSEKKEIIKKAIKTLGYHGNSIAKSLKTNKSMTIAFIIPSVTNHFFSKLAETVQTKLTEHNYRMVLYITNNDDKIEKRLIKEVVADHADGIIVSTGSKECSEIYESLVVPIVSLDSEISDNIPVIISNNSMGTKELTKHLHTKGCQNILFIESSNQNIIPAIYRKNGFVSYCEENALLGHLIDDSDLELTLNDINFVNKFDAIMVWNDQTAFYVSNILYRLGIEVGKDILLTGYDNSLFSKYMNPPLTTANQPTDLIGKKTVEILLDIIDGNPSGNRRFVFHNPIILRESTGD